VKAGQVMLGEPYATLLDVECGVSVVTNLGLSSDARSFDVKAQRRDRYRWHGVFFGIVIDVLMMII
jgi:hypothetical protein